MNEESEEIITHIYEALESGEVTREQVACLIGEVAVVEMRME